MTLGELMQMGWTWQGPIEIRTRARTKEYGDHPDELVPAFHLPALHAQFTGSIVPSVVPGTRTRFRSAGSRSLSLTNRDSERLPTQRLLSAWTKAVSTSSERHHVHPRLEARKRNLLSKVTKIVNSPADLTGSFARYRVPTLMTYSLPEGATDPIPAFVLYGLTALLHTLLSVTYAISLALTRGSFI
jgi:hypothetical protein